MVRCLLLLLLMATSNAFMPFKPMVRYVRCDRSVDDSSFVFRVVMYLSKRRYRIPSASVTLNHAKEKGDIEYLQYSHYPKFVLH
jgi:hypothetical protein